MQCEASATVKVYWARRSALLPLICTTANIRWLWYDGIEIAIKLVHDNHCGMTDEAAEWR